MDTDPPGISMTPMWCVGSTTAERTNVPFFDKVKVPKNRLVGEMNKGFYYLMQALDYERFAITAAAQHQPPLQHPC
ncbi:MAG: acyl-CoA/acyl-ACP dehydrogenase [Haliea sp.]|nr:acyl-CoA/acyl-ACP dehydrogenase [Haliea sp.]